MISTPTLFQCISCVNRIPASVTAARLVAARHGLDQRRPSMIDEVAAANPAPRRRAIEAHTELTVERATGLVNAVLRRLAREGQDYFDGLKGYLESGKQLKPDPTGADQPGQNIAAVNTARSSMPLRSTELILPPQLISHRSYL